MAIITQPVYGGPFDSTEVVEEIGGFPRGDKAVDAAFFAKMISCFWADGVLGPSSFAVVPGTGLTVTVSPGVAWIRGYMAWQKTPLSLTLAAGKTWSVRLRLNEAVGEFSLVAADDGSAPLDTAQAKDLVLAEITAAQGASSIDAAAINDTRADRNKCGIVTSTVDALSAVETASNAHMLGGYASSAYLRRSGGTMTGALLASADVTGAAVVRNIAYGTAIPASLRNGELFVLLAE